MAKHFRRLVVRAKESNDVAMARAGIEVAFLVQDHVLWAFDLTQADRTRLAQDGY